MVILNESIHIFFAHTVQRSSSKCEMFVECDIKLNISHLYYCFVLCVSLTTSLQFILSYSPPQVPKLLIVNAQILTITRNQ